MAEKVVRVTTDKPTYRPAEAIAVCVRNGLDQTVRASSQYSFCTILTLERKQDDTWDPIAPCALLRPAATVDIEPALTMQVRLPPSEQPDPRPRAGTYRVVFQYQVVDRERSKQLSTGIAYSDSFTLVEH